MNLKKILFTLITACSITSVASAATATPSATPKSTDAVKNTKIENLKERLATKVAELRKTTPKAISGTVTATSISTITVDTDNKGMKIELKDDIVVYQILKGKLTKLAIENVEKEDDVTVFGDYDSTLDSLEAKTIFIEAPTKPIRLHGKIKSIDKKNNNVVLTGIDGESYTISVEATTKTNAWSKENGIEKAGFSKLSEGTFVSILATAIPKKTNEYEANRILIIGLNLPITATPVASPSAEIKTTPTKTPTPTKKTTPTSTKKVTPTP